MKYKKYWIPPLVAGLLLFYVVYTEAYYFFMFPSELTMEVSSVRMDRENDHYVMYHKNTSYPPVEIDRFFWIEHPMFTNSSLSKNRLALLVNNSVRNGLNLLTFDCYIDLPALLSNSSYLNCYKIKLTCDSVEDFAKKLVYDPYQIVKNDLVSCKTQET